MSDFNYIEYLKNNPLLRMDLNDQLINENMDNTKMKKSELKSKIRETILSTLEE